MQNIIDRFWNKVIVKYDTFGNPLLNECMEWDAFIDKDGYGVFTVSGKKVRAHRYIYMYHFGKVSSELCICHNCDNRKCVNSNHLFVGTWNDNIQDSIRKNRNAIGSQMVGSKLLESDVVLIKQQLQRGISQDLIADNFNVGQTTISRINRGVSWKHVTI